MLFLLSIACSITHFELQVKSDAEIDPQRDWAMRKYFYITDAATKFLNLAIMLLFFYMAFRFDGKLLSSYKETFERLQQLAVFAD